jgi:holo-[acyl-carrier protein] synthase
MIVGIGTDVCSIERIAASLSRFGERFVKRILTPAERPRFERAKDKAGHLAKRFAAKEAFSKAIGTGIHAPFTWQSITVTRDARGKPGIEPDRAMAGYLASRGVDSFHISLTDDGDVAMAFVILEGKGPR